MAAGPGRQFRAAQRGGGLIDPGAAAQPFRDTRPLLQAITQSCRSGLVSRKGRKAAPMFSDQEAVLATPWASFGARRKL
ncbi:hypothetical protein DMX06_18765 [Pseudomonas mosselii]|nr:hypothetical protein DMX06_18765 [Pseudomonas mosselii]